MMEVRGQTNQWLAGEHVTLQNMSPKASATYLFRLYLSKIACTFPWEVLGQVVTFHFPPTEEEHRWR